MCQERVEIWKNIAKRVKKAVKCSGWQYHLEKNRVGQQAWKRITKKLKMGHKERVFEEDVLCCDKLWLCKMTADSVHSLCLLECLLLHQIIGCGTYYFEEGDKPMILMRQMADIF